MAVCIINIVINHQFEVQRIRSFKMSTPTISTNQVRYYRSNHRMEANLSELHLENNNPYMPNPTIIIHDDNLGSVEYNLVHTFTDRMGTPEAFEYWANIANAADLMIFNK